MPALILDGLFIIIDIVTASIGGFWVISTMTALVAAVVDLYIFIVLYSLMHVFKKEAHNVRLEVTAEKMMPNREELK